MKDNADRNANKLISLWQQKAKIENEKIINPEDCNELLRGPWVDPLYFHIDNDLNKFDEQMKDENVPTPRRKEIIEGQEDLMNQQRLKRTIHDESSSLRHLVSVANFLFEYPGDNKNLMSQIINHCYTHKTFNHIKDGEEAIKTLCEQYRIPIAPTPPAHTTQKVSTSPSLKGESSLISRLSSCFGKTGGKTPN